MKRAIAAAHLLLIFPAVLFLGSVIVQRLSQPAQAAQHVVMWYAARMWTLWLLLLALPLSVLISGCILLRQDWSGRAQVGSTPEKALATLHPAGVRTFLTVTTATAAVIVVVVILHMLAN